MVLSVNRTRLILLVVALSASGIALLITARRLRVVETVRQLRALISTGPEKGGVNPTLAGTAGREFDHHVFDRLLTAYVNDEGWVDYDGLGRDRPRLDLYLAELATASPQSFPNDAERLAFWINAYNAFTLKGVLDDVYRRAKGVREVPGFFDQKRHTVAGAGLTLEEVEQRGRGFHDPRIHFALVCASASCPKLQRFAYTGPTLDDQLNGAARGFLADPARGLRIDRERNQIFLSPIFEWYAGDFLGASSSTGRAVALVKAVVSGSEILSYIKKYSPPDATHYIEEKKPDVRYLGYDWSLNAQEMRTNVLRGARPERQGSTSDDIGRNLRARRHQSYSEIRFAL